MNPTAVAPAAPNEPAEIGQSARDLTGAQRTAILLIALGTDVASVILKQLPDSDVEKITIEIARCRNISSHLVEEVLVEFRDLSMAQGYIAQGGVPFAREALETALGSRRAEEIMMRVEAAMHVSAFHLLQTVETGQLANFLQNEHPQTAALIIAHLNSRKSADIISNLTPELQSEIMFRLATMGKTSPALLRDIEEVIRQQIGALFGTELSASGGIEAVAEILNSSNRQTERNILDGLKDRDNELATSIKNLMFTFEDLGDLSDRDLQRILVEIEQRDLALALRAASESLKEKLLGNLSERAAQMMQEEIELMGPVRVSDVDDAQRRIIETAHMLEEAEEVVLSGGGEELLM